MKQNTALIEAAKSRRERLGATLRSHPAVQSTGAAPAALLFSPRTAIRNASVEHEFRADSDIAYLTAFEEPETVLLLLPEEDGCRTVLFVRPRDKEREIWDGRREGPEGVCANYGIDEAYPTDALGKELPRLLKGRGAIFSHLGRNTEDDQQMLSAVARVRAGCRKKGVWPRLFVDLSAALHEMRQCKDAGEVASLEQASRATAQGHLQAMKGVRPGLLESDLEAVLTYAFRREGARRHGYQPIVAGGENACILHYIENDAPLRAGELVLIDAGAEFQLYTGDVTRTFPVSGTFTQPQKEIYEIVLAANEAAIAAAKPGATLSELDQIARRELAKGLIRLQILDVDQQSAVTKMPFEGMPEGHPGKAPLDRFYMHSTGHWLGMDVHDVGAYHDGGVPTPFVPGMVFTVEPGLYFAPDDESVAPAYRGIGVRIEDNILISEDGHRVLSAAVPKAVAELEALVGTEPL